MKEYTNKPLAQLEVIRQREKTKPKMFCPLINGTCNKACVCIGEPFIKGNGSFANPTSTKFVVVGWHCTNPMLIGEY